MMRMRIRINNIIIKSMKQHGQEKSTTGERMIQEFLYNKLAQMERAKRKPENPFIFLNSDIFVHHQGSVLDAWQDIMILNLDQHLFVHQGALLDACQCHHIHTVGR